MFHTSNPEIDVARLTARVRQVAQHRYHSQSLAGVTAPASVEPMVAPWRRQIKRVPVLGPLLVWGAARWRRVANPELARSERWRAVPVAGDVAAWGLALLQILQWRGSLRRQLEQAQHDLAELRREQNQTRRELEQLRQQCRERWRKQASSAPSRRQDSDPRP